VDEPPVQNGRVSSRELYAAISSLREELATAQRAQAADVMAAVAATEQRLAARIDCLEATVNAHDDILQQLKGAKALLTLIFGASMLTATIGVMTLLGHLG
jgi:NAD-specific glutamate dehydrogenase